MIPVSPLIGRRPCIALRPRLPRFRVSGGAHLPPYSPELNAIEKVWQYLRDRYLSGRLFSGIEAIVEACCTAWNSLIAETGRIRSLTDFEWAQPVNQ